MPSDVPVRISLPIAMPDDAFGAALIEQAAALRPHAAVPAETGQLQQIAAKALQDGKEHPTQKPVMLMSWCLGFVPKARTILDPFMGSGTTAIACIDQGRSFIGIERDEGYFAIAERRIAEAQSQLMAAE